MAEKYNSFNLYGWFQLLFYYKFFFKMLKFLFNYNKINLFNCSEHFCTINLLYCVLFLFHVCGYFCLCVRVHKFTTMARAPFLGSHAYWKQAVNVNLVYYYNVVLGFYLFTSVKKPFYFLLFYICYLFVILMSEHV